MICGAIKYWLELARVKEVMDPAGRRLTECKEGDRKKILCEETRGKSQEVAVGKLTPLHNYIFSTASQHLR